MMGSVSQKKRSFQSPKRRRQTGHALAPSVDGVSGGGCPALLVNSFIPMAGSIKSILNAVVVIAVVLWLMNIFGLMHSLSRIHIGA